MTRLLRRIHRLPMLRRAHEHDRLWWLARLGALVHHHRRAPTGTRISAVWLWRGCSMLGISMRRAGRVHLHLRIIGSGHSLRHSHVWTAGGLLDHHWRTHPVLRVDKLGRARILTHVRRLRSSLVNIELWHGLAKGELSMRTHRGWISNVAVLKSW